MGILNIAPAERAGAHLLIQLYGPPRSGKTFTALRIARGMVGPKGKIGVLDTESGRARLYSDKVPGGFVVGELTPPQGQDHGVRKTRHRRLGLNQIRASAAARHPKSCPRRRCVQPRQGRRPGNGRPSAPLLCDRLASAREAMVSYR